MPYQFVRFKAQVSPYLCTLHCVVGTLGILVVVDAFRFIHIAMLMSSHPSSQSGWRVQLLFSILHVAVALEVRAPNQSNCPLSLLVSMTIDPSGSSASPHKSSILFPSLSVAVKSPVKSRHSWSAIVGKKHFRPHIPVCVCAPVPQWMRWNNTNINELWTKYLHLLKGRIGTILSRGNDLSEAIGRSWCESCRQLTKEHWFLQGKLTTGVLLVGLKKGQHNDALRQESYYYLATLGGGIEGGLVDGLLVCTGIRRFSFRKGRNANLAVYSSMLMGWKSCRSRSLPTFTSYPLQVS